MDNRMNTLETRFDTILPTLATKEDLKTLEIHLVKTIHVNYWKMISWMTAVVGMKFIVVYFVARYVPA